MTRTALIPFMQRHLHWFVFGGLALFIFLPVLNPGYILAVDMVFAPSISLPEGSSPTWWLYAFLKLLSVLLPVWLIQKILLIAIFMVSGIGAYFLLRQLLPAASRGSWYAGSVLYAYNPFVYTRLMTGQYEILLGYSLLPLLLLYLVRLLKAVNLKDMVRVGILYGFIGIASLHMLGLATLLAGGFIVAALWQNRHRRKEVLALLKYGAGALGIAMFISSNWLVPLLLGKSDVTSTVGSFTTEDFAAFQTSGEGLGVIGNILTLQGFWADNYDLYLLPGDVFAWWLLPVLAVVALVGLGIVRALRQQRYLAITFLAISVVACILAAGTADSLFKPINTWLVEHISVFAGYRDSQKFSALLALSYSFFFAVGAYSLLRYGGRKMRYLIIVVLGSVLLLWAPLLPLAGHWQLQANNYPQGWHTAHTYLRQHVAQGEQVLFLPWHKYMPLSFSGVTTANPAPKFFEMPIVASSNPEFGNAKGYTSSELQEWLDVYLPTEAKNDSAFAQKLSQKNIRYILLAKEFDHHQYRYLNNKPGVTVVVDTPSIVLYRVSEVKNL